MIPNFCANCGAALPAGARFCSSCGAAVPPVPPPAQGGPSWSPVQRERDRAGAVDSAPRAPSEAGGELAFTFQGRAGEYFGIWIVNVLLSLITLGIYSAWAKVRRVRYFYGNTWLDGHNFEYHARPSRILIGRLIVVAVLVVYQVLVTISPAFAVLLIIYAFVLPWAVNTALAFNARMTSYRNVRFAFRGSYWPAFGIYLGMPIAVLLSAGLLLPVFSRLSANYVGNGLSYGTARFHTQARLGPLYANLGLAALIPVCAIGLAVLLTVAASSGRF
ncbi:DUF898 family protein [Alsobacter sp. SYSU M60028]|uniref:DUF898 family protein n=1 Tax=Alsobacter ponti TaxID=2962936 RepID=A0ABT1LH46_9HYPH|nr:DUF898 family protein [Alsobacter ponti]MCP8940832.1 DUF898 family protein [Alsobacter ponti]